MTPKSPGPKSPLTDLKARWAVELGLGKNPVAQFGAPVSFTAHLDSITPGQTQMMAVSGLANGFRTPYIIDEIHMCAYMATPSATVLQPSLAMQFQFRTGSYAFSKVPVPMVLHAPVYNTQTEALLSVFAGGLTRIGDEARWLLAKPLWMAPGDQIQAVVLRDSSVASLGGGAFTVDVTYIGRSLKPGTPGPKTRYVPWVAHYLHDFALTYSETTTEFRNPFMTGPLHVHRLIGRPLSKATSGVNLATAHSSMLPNAADEKFASILIEDSMGYKVTRDYHPVGQVFDTERCVWTFNRPLGPRDQFNMKFRTLGSVAVGSPVFGVGMLGYREETA